MNRCYRSVKTAQDASRAPVSMTPTVSIGIHFCIEVDGVRLEGKMNPAGKLSESGMPIRVTVFPKSKQPFALIFEDNRWYIFGGLDYPELVEKLVGVLTAWYR